MGQEATHRRLHGLFNSHLDKLGLVNEWADRATQRLKLLDGLDPRHALGITAANEHFTAIMADWMLRNPDLVGSDDSRLSTLWLWHSAEESEHKSTAFDLYQALGGNHEWRSHLVPPRHDDLPGRHLAADRGQPAPRRHAVEVARPGRAPRQPSSAGAASIRQTLRPWRAYLREDFHPAQQDSEPFAALAGRAQRPLRSRGHGRLTPPRELFEHRRPVGAASL